MIVYLTAFAVFALAMLGMAIGVLISNRRLRGSCGGLAGMTDERGRTLCEACTTPSESCAGVAEGLQRSADEPQMEESASQ